MEILGPWRLWGYGYGHLPVMYRWPSRQMIERLQCMRLSCIFVSISSIFPRQDLVSFNASHPQCLRCCRPADQPSFALPRSTLVPHNNWTSRIINCRSNHPPVLPQRPMKSSLSRHLCRPRGYDDLIQNHTAVVWCGRITESAMAVTHIHLDTPKTDRWTT